MIKTIIWLKRDLRINDQPLLSSWKIAPNKNSLVHFQFQNIDVLASASKRQFRNGAIKDFAKSVNGCLRVIATTQDQFLKDFEKLIESERPEQVMTSAEYAFDEWIRNNAVQVLCRQKGIEFKAINTFTLHEGIDTESLPRIFTDFRKKIECQPISFNEVEQINLTTQTAPGLKRLDYYLFRSQRIQSYKITRNGLLDPDDSSHFSPYLSIGAISVKRIWKEVERYEREFSANESTYWMKFELLWREFFIWNALKYQNKIFLAGGLKGIAREVIDSESLFFDWIYGRTSDDFVNANMNELRLTGWMSNRGRQIVASYLIHDLNLDWRLGAKWFEQQLIDEEPCANWGNWSYIAGVGNDPRPYRKFNLGKQRAEYDPQGEYVKKWLKNNEP